MHHVSHSSYQLSAFKARLGHLAHAYCIPVNVGDFLDLKECNQAFRPLRRSNNIHMAKPDKSFGVVIMLKNE